MTQYPEHHSDSDDDFAETNSSSGEFSPTDGYFRDRDHPQDVFIQSPTTSVSKDQEAAAESPTPASSSQRIVHEYRIPSSPPRHESNERTPLLYDAPPPAYSAPQSLYQPPTPNNEPEVAASSSSNILFPEREPESMGHPPDDYDTERMQYGYTRPEKSLASRFCGGAIKIVAVLIAIVALPFLLGEAVVGSGKSSGKDRLSDGPDPEPQMPAMPKLPHWCSQTSSKSASFEFDNPSSFRFEENIDTNDFHGGIYGNVRLVVAPSSQKEAIRVDVSMTSSDLYPLADLRFEKSSNHLVLKTPLYDHKEDHWDGSRNPCMCATVSIFLKKGLSLDKLDVSTRVLGVDLGKELDIKVNKTAIDVRVASVNSDALALFYSRETRINVGTGSINGHYNLYDLLSIKSSSGSITVDVTPKEAGEDEKPAKFDVESKTGSVTVQMPPRDFASKIPKREYQTSVQTLVGSIHGNYIHGSSTIFESRTGSINFDLLPYSADDHSSTFRTTAQSGMTNIVLKSPYKGSTIKRMTSSHHTKTGSLHVLYPQEWEGTIKGETTTGSLTLRGKDVVVEEYDDGWVSKKVRAKKGKGDVKGSLDFATTTGSADVTIGDTLAQYLKRELCEKDLESILD